MNKNIVLIFSGYNIRGIIAYCRFFRLHDIEFFIISCGPLDPIYNTIYKNKVIFERIGAELILNEFNEYYDIINSKGPFDKIIILPTSEFLNRFILENESYLNSFCYIIPLVNLELYKQISDKYSFSEICKKNNIGVPIEYDFVNMESIPFVAKPKSYFLNNKNVNSKPILINSEADYYQFLNLKEDYNFYFQEFVGGESYYLLYYFDKNQQYSVYSQQNLVQQADGLSIIAALSSDFHIKHNISKNIADILISLKYRGLIMIEFKSYNNKFYMIEANPRIWGPSQLLNDANMNLIFKFCKDFGLLNAKSLYEFNYKIGVKYFWGGGIKEDERKGVDNAFHCFDKQSFMDGMDSWVNHDIYLHEDTIELFNKENKY